MNAEMKKLSSRISIIPQIIIAVLFLTTPAISETLVSPANRVTTRLNVREFPSAQDTIPVVGKLLKNETAVLVESVHRWYLIRLDNGVEGYVNKSWADTTSLAASVEELRIRLGAWNVKKLGHGASKNYSAVANVIESNFDAVAIIEVMQKQGGHPGYDRLLTELGPGWVGIVSQEQRPKTNSGHAEFYAVLYRSQLLRLSPGWTGLRYFQDHDGSNQGVGDDFFTREPAYVFLEVVQTDGTVACDFLFGTYHARWQGGSISAISAEVGHMDDVLTEMAATVNGENDVWLVGDFNLVPENLDPLTAATDIAVGEGSTLNHTGARTANLYEHFLVRDIGSSGELVGTARILDVREVAQAPDVFYGSVSDHLPIMVEVHATADDD